MVMQAKCHVVILILAVDCVVLQLRTSRDLPKARHCNGALPCFHLRSGSCPGLACRLPADGHLHDQTRVKSPGTLGRTRQHVTVLDSPIQVFHARWF